MARVSRLAALLGPASFSILAALFVVLVPSVAVAEQFVLLDVTFTYTKMDADTSTPDKSHYYVQSDRLNPNRPHDWTAPIDYRHGVVHVHTEVIDKPAGGENVRWTLCYIPNKGIGAGYGCTNSALYSDEGTFEFEQSMTEWWQNDAIDWTQGIRQVDLVMKDGTSPTGFTHLRPDSEKFFPTTLRMTMIQVSAGSTYDPSKIPTLPSADGGAARDGASDAPSMQGAVDAARVVDGASNAGSAGAGGTTGEAGSANGGGAGAMTGGAVTATTGNGGFGGSSGAGVMTGPGGSEGSKDGAQKVAPSGDEGGCSLGARPARGRYAMGLLVALTLMAARRRR